MPQWRHYWLANNYSIGSSQGRRFKLHPATVSFAAILDRVMHNAIVFNIRGPSWRLRGHHGLGMALVMAGSEVTVEEAVSLLGCRLPLEPTEVARVRAKAVTHDDRRAS
jgi:hypothetical protein